jgi:hypothetical protein
MAASARTVFELLQQASLARDMGAFERRESSAAWC